MNKYHDEKHIKSTSIRINPIELVNHLKQHNEKAIIYGTGALSEITLRALRSRGVETEVFCDANKQKQGGTHLGVSVISPEALKQNYNNPAVFICIREQFKVVYDALCEYGFDRVADVCDLIRDMPVKDFDGIGSVIVQQWKEAYIDIRELEDTAQKGIKNERSLGFAITERCTLNCKHCQSIIPYVRNKQDIPASQIIKSIDKAFGILCDIREVGLSGGEPLLHKELAEILIHLSKYESVTTITLPTNATVIPNERTLMTLSGFKKSHVHISNYGSLSHKKDELIKRLDEYGIPCYVEDNAPYWIDMGDLHKRNYPEERLRNIFSACGLKQCHSIYRGKLFLCLRAAFAQKTDISEAAANPGNYVDLFDESLTDEQLREKMRIYLHEIPYLPMCDYCDGGDITGRHVPAAIQA